MADGLSDEDVLGRFLNGDETAFATLVRRHQDRIFSLACRMMGDRGDALEATQETFLLALRQAAAFRGQSAFGTWLYKIGINACRDLLRKKKRWARPDDDIEARAATASAPSLDEAVALRLDVARALAALPLEYREAVAMHDLGGVPYEEIAATTKAPLGTVKSRISRGRRMLAELLEQPVESRSSKKE